MTGLFVDLHHRSLLGPSERQNALPLVGSAQALMNRTFSSRSIAWSFDASSMPVPR